MQLFNEYQHESAKTAIYDKAKALEYLTLGLVSEAGEVAGKVKKLIRDNNSELTDEKRVEILKEIGDCIWYISQLYTELGYEFARGAQDNLDKLLSRLERGTLGGSGDNR